MRQDSVTRKAVLLGTAGLLPSQWLGLKSCISNIPEIKKLESIWQKKSKTETLKRGNWNFFRVRPENYPTRRVVALGCLIDRYHSQGLADSVLRLIRKRSNGFEHQCIESGLKLFCDDYWSDHTDFGITKIKKPRSSGRRGPGKWL